MEGLLILCLLMLMLAAIYMLFPYFTCALLITVLICLAFGFEMSIWLFLLTYIIIKIVA